MGSEGDGGQQGNGKWGKWGEGREKAVKVNEDETHRRPWEHGTYAGQAFQFLLSVFHSGGKLHLAIIGKWLHVGLKDCELIKKLCPGQRVQLPRSLHFSAYQMHRTLIFQPALALVKVELKLTRIFKISTNKK